MSKIVRTTDTEYKIITAAGGNITLDTTNASSDGTGRVIVRGDLEVQGNTTQVESRVVTIQDNIIILSKGNDGELPATLDRPYSSGIEIERLGSGNARWVYDDSYSWNLGGQAGRGVWLGELGNIGSATILPLLTDKLLSGGNDLVVSLGSSSLRIDDTQNYEEKVWRYENGQITPDPITNSVFREDNVIPNAKAVRDFVDFRSTNIEVAAVGTDDTNIIVNDKNNVILSILETGSSTTLGFAKNHGFSVGDTITIQDVTSVPIDPNINAINGVFTVTDVPNGTSLTINLSSTGGDTDAYVQNSGRTVDIETDIRVTVNGTNILNIFDNRVELSGLKIVGNEIINLNNDEDILINASGNGSVKIKDILEITKTPGENDPTIDPLAPSDGVKVYSKTQGPGGTGVYFVNEDSVQGEFISKNRALIYGMLF